MPFDLDPTYKQVPERIADFKAVHPDGCLRPVDPARPYWFEERGDKTFIVYAAAAYRQPDDPLPGIGLAWELYPGRTPYTKDSELQNAETSAWGRAIVAVLASESKSVASAEDVRNRQASVAEDERRKPVQEPLASPEDHQAIRNVRASHTEAQTELHKVWWQENHLPPITTSDRLTEAQAQMVYDHLDELEQNAALELEEDKALAFSEAVERDKPAGGVTPEGVLADAAVESPPALPDHDNPEAIEALHDQGLLHPDEPLPKGGSPSTARDALAAATAKSTELKKTAGRR